MTEERELHSKSTRLIRGATPGCRAIGDGRASIDTISGIAMFAPEGGQSRRQVGMAPSEDVLRMSREMDCVHRPRVDGVPQFSLPLWRRESRVGIHAQRVFALLVAAAFHSSAGLGHRVLSGGSDCSSCDQVPCGSCQEGCPRSSVGCDPPFSHTRNGCKNSNKGQHPGEHDGRPEYTRKGNGGARGIRLQYEKCEEEWRMVYGDFTYYSVKSTAQRPPTDGWKVPRDREDAAPAPTLSLCTDE